MTIADSFFFSSGQLTETRQGFCDLDLVRLSTNIPTLSSMVEDLFKAGFRYCGDTNSDSNAYTEIEKKRIHIRRNKPIREACLSLGYELTNAKNAPRIDEVYRQYLFSDEIPSMEKATQYADAILLIEAEAIFNRSILAIELGLESFVKNKKYLEIVKSNKENYQSAISELFLEMKKNGTVHNGKIKAVAHYISQYFEYGRKTEKAKGIDKARSRDLLNSSHKRDASIPSGDKAHPSHGEIPT